jgi:hypothetical protein
MASAGGGGGGASIYAVNARIGASLLGAGLPATGFSSLFGGSAGSLAGCGSCFLRNNNMVSDPAFAQARRRDGRCTKSLQAHLKVVKAEADGSLRARFRATAGGKN